jgi:hypothetical protein
VTIEDVDGGGRARRDGRQHPGEEGGGVRCQARRKATCGGRARREAALGDRARRGGAVPLGISGGAADGVESALAGDLLLCLFLLRPPPPAVDPRTPPTPAGCRPPLLSLPPIGRRTLPLLPPAAPTSSPPPSQHSRHAARRPLPLR